MGLKHRLMHAWRGRVGRVARFALAGALLAGCSHKPNEDEARKHAILKARDLDTKRAVAIEKARIVDDKGDLLASDTKLAGVFLPRGLEVKFGFEHEWYLDGVMSRDRVERYFRQHLDVKREAHPANDTLEFTGADVKDTIGVEPVTVRIYAQPGYPDGTRVYLREHVMLNPRFQSMTPDQIRAEIEQKHQHLE